MALVDHRGRPVETARLRRPETGMDSLAAVRRVSAGHPAAGMTPSRLARLLRTAETGDATAWLALAEEMEERDAHYMAVLSTRKRQIEQLPVTVVAADDSAAAEADAGLVREVLPAVLDARLDILDALGKGVSFVEIDWETSARDWRPRRLIWRPPHWFAFGRASAAPRGGLMDAGIRGADGTVRPLPAWRYIVHEARAKSGLPVRGGLARVCCWPFLYKSFSIRDWVLFAEVYGQPVRIGRYHAEARAEDKAVLRRALTNLGSDAAAMIPESMQLEFVQAGGVRASADLYVEMAKYMDQQMSKAVLGQTATTDAISGGHAVSREHNAVRADIEAADCRGLAATLERDLVRPMIELNHGPRTAWPRIEICRPEAVDIGALANAIAALAPHGLRVSQSEVLRKLGLSEPAGDDNILGAAGGGDPRPARLAMAAARPVQDSLDDLAAEMLAEWTPAAGSLVDPVRERVAAADTLETLRDRLAMAVQKMGRRDLADMLARGLFAARTAGEVGADID